MMEEDIPLVTRQGLKIFDPRDGTYKQSNNPALVLNDLIERFGIIYDLAQKPNWVEFVKQMADFCDEKVEGVT